jgi:hypothetical protein
MILFLGIITSYEDIRYGKIKNKWIIAALSYAIVVNIVIIILYKLTEQPIRAGYFYELIATVVFSLVFGVIKIKYLFKLFSCLRWLHSFGPKKYEFLHHFSALFIRFFYRFNYRHVKKLLDWLCQVCPSKSTLQKTSAKLDTSF